MNFNREKGCKHDHMLPSEHGSTWMDSKTHLGCSLQYLPAPRFTSTCHTEAKFSQFSLTIHTTFQTRSQKFYKTEKIVGKGFYVPRKKAAEHGNDIVDAISPLAAVSPFSPAFPIIVCLKEQ